MKKLFLTFIAFFAVSVSVMADGHVDSVRYLTTRWRRNWFVSADATISWWQGSLRVPEAFSNSFTKVYWNDPHFGVHVNFGKWINHKTALRFSYDNTVISSFIYGRHPRLEHIQFLYGDDPVVAEADLHPNRVWTPVFYLSAGAALTSNELFLTKNLINFVNYSKPKDVTKVDGTNFELSLGAGLLNNFRISEHFDINLDIKWNFHRWTLDSWAHEYPDGGPAFFDNNAENIRPKRFDNMYSAALGLTYYFSRIYDLPSFDTAIADKGPCDTIVKIVTIQTDEMVSYPFSIFFHRDSYELMSGRDLVNLAEIARVAKEYNYKIRLRGSCDSATATPSYNQTLSENRCRKIMSELLKMDIPEDQIILMPIGGIKELNPTEYDRRVVIELVKDVD